MLQRVLAIAAMCFVVSTANAMARDLAGTWLVEDQTAIVEIYSCDEKKTVKNSVVPLEELCLRTADGLSSSKNNWCGRVIEVTPLGQREARSSGIDPETYDALPILCVDKRRRAGELYSVKGQGLFGNHHRIQVRSFNVLNPNAVQFEFCIWAGCKAQVWRRQAPSREAASR